MFFAEKFVVDILLKNILVIRTKYIIEYKINCHNKVYFQIVAFADECFKLARFLFLISMAKIYYIISLRTWQ